MSNEQTDTGTGAESLDALAVEAQRLDAAPEQAAQAERIEQASEIADNNAAELLATLMLARAMALPILPTRKAQSLAGVWTDSVLQQASEAGAAVMALHDIQMGAVMGRYAPYIALIAALAGPVLATRAILGEPEPKKADVVVDGQQ